MNTSNHSKIWTELIDFVSTKTGFSQTTSLSQQSTLNRDIGLDGDDADEFMAEYFDHFMIEYGDYDWSNYFGEEGFNPVSLLIDIANEKPVAKPLTLGMLEPAAAIGKWDTKALERASSNNDYSFN